MNCWHVLGIAASTDKKAIKRAYATLLKKTRPDDDPEGFKTLHAAYQQALAYNEYVYAQYVHEEEEDTSSYAEYPEEQSAAQGWQDHPAASLTQESLPTLSTPSDRANINILHKPALTTESLSAPEEEAHSARPDEHAPLTESLPAPPDKASAETIADTMPAPDSNPSEYSEHTDYQSENYQAELNKDWQTFLDTVLALLRQPKRVNQVEAWHFLETLPSMLDLEFRADVSNKLFGIVAEANAISLKKKVLYIKTPVLDYLNDSFQWDKHWAHLKAIYAEEMLSAVLPHLSAGQSKGTPVIKELHYYSRIGAFVLDSFICFFFALFINLLLKQGAEGLVVIAVLYLLTIIPLLEASPWQASPGKRSMGLRVINRQGLRMPLYQSFWRAAVTLGCLAGFKIVVWINIVIAWKKNMLLQDVLSQSYVVRRHRND